MSVQQINLYQPERFERKVPFGFSTLLGVVGLSLLFIIVVIALLSWQVHRLGADLSAHQKRQIEAAAHLAEFQRQYPPPAKSARLEEELRQLIAERDSKEPLMQQLALYGDDASGGFSAHLSGLARQSMDGVWLRRIVVAEAGAQLLLEGSALNPELVPRYLERLSRETAFAGAEFSRFQLLRPKENGGLIDFRVATSGIREEKP